MKQQFRFIAKSSVLVLAIICLQSFSFHRRGGDYFKVLLNGRMVAEQYLTKPVALKTLSLNAANRNDKLTVYYSHCGRAGSSRAISLKNEEGKVLKQWEFADAPSQEMQVPVSEVLKASSSLNTVSFYYSSKEIPSGKQIITFNLSTIALNRL
jgi:hypothetical protein